MTTLMLGGCALTAATLLYLFRHPLAKRLHDIADWDESRAQRKKHEKEQKKEMRRRRKAARR